MNFTKASLPKYKKLQIIPVLFTPRDIRRSEDSKVRIADKSVIELIFKEVVKGNSKRARMQL